jgi:hypothetical protein
MTEVFMSGFSGQADLEYYPSGAIKSYVTLLSDEFQIGEQFVKVAESTIVSFHPNGNLKSFFLADATKLVFGKYSRLVLENEKVDLLEDGTLDLTSAKSNPIYSRGLSLTFIEALSKFFRISDAGR